jgi:hypothetical protein
MTDKITKITPAAPVHIPKHHRKWAGLEEEEEKEPEDNKKKNELDTNKLDKLIRRVYDQKIVTYDKKGNIVEHSEKKEDNNSG